MSIRRIIIRPIEPLGRRVLNLDTKTFTEEGKVIYLADDGTVQTVTKEQFNKGKDIRPPKPTIRIDRFNMQHVIEIDESIGSLAESVKKQLENFWYKHHNVKELTGTKPNPNLKSTFEFELVDDEVYDRATIERDTVILDARSTFMAMDETKQKQAAILCGISVSNKSHKKVIREMASLLDGYICGSKERAEEFMGHLDVLNDKVIVNTYFGIELGVIANLSGVYTYVGQTIGRSKGECSLFMKNNMSIFNQLLKDIRAKQPDINFEGETAQEKESKRKGSKEAVEA